MSHNLKNELETQLNSLSGKVALSVNFLSSYEKIEVNETVQFWAASVIKVPIAATVYKQAAEGKFDLATRVNIDQANIVQGSGVTKLLNPKTLYTIQELVTLMLVVSDNSATNQLVDLVGAESIEHYMQDCGLASTTFRHKMMIPAGKGPNMTTTSDMTKLLELVYTAQLPGSNLIVETMTEQLDRTKIPLYIPNEVKIAHKYGALPQAVHEIGIVYSKNPFSFCFLSDDQEDKLKTAQTLARSAKMCYDYSESAKV